MHFHKYTSYDVKVKQNNKYYTVEEFGKILVGRNIRRIRILN